MRMAVYRISLNFAALEIPSSMLPSMLLLVVVIPDAVIAGHAHCAALYEQLMRAISEQLCENQWLAKLRCKTMLGVGLESGPHDHVAENIVVAARGHGWTPSTIPEVVHLIHMLCTQVSHITVMNKTNQSPQ